MLATGGILLCVFLAVFLVCLGAATWQAISSKRRTWHRLYWATSGLLMWVGGVGSAFFLMFPPDHFDKDGHLIGEMPPEVGFTAAIAQLGFYLALLGLVSIGLTRSSKSVRARDQ